MGKRWCIRYWVLFLSVLLLASCVLEGRIPELDAKSPSQMILGIDVALPNAEDLNWDEVDSQGFRFAWIKATEGIGWCPDSTACTQGNLQYCSSRIQAVVEKARASEDRVVGLFHYARPVANKDCAKLEAFWFAMVVNSVLQGSPGELMLALDVEDLYSGGTLKERPSNLGKEALSE